MTSSGAELFLFTRIFRAFRIAVRPSKILLALAALVCMYAGGRTLDAMWPQKFIDDGYKVRHDVETIFSTVRPPFASFANDQIENFKAMTDAVLSGDWSYPGGAPEATARFMLQTPLEYWLGNKLFFTLLFAWFLVVWAFFGGAIARIAAIHVTRDEVISPMRALRFSARAFPSFLAAPLIPFIMVLVLGIIVSVMGLLLYIPYFGPIATGLILVVPLVLGILMMLLTVGSIAGSGLMYPTIAVEGSDAFDAVSRARVTSSPPPGDCCSMPRWPWRMGPSPTSSFASASSSCSGSCTSSWDGFWLGMPSVTWNAMWPAPTMQVMAFSPDWAYLNWDGDAGAAIGSFWIYLAIALVGAYVISFYFSASTIVYVLMRRKVDAAEMDQVYLEPADEELPSTEATPEAPASPTPASPITDTPGTHAGEPPKPNV